MSLSARIAMAPSHRLARLATVVQAGGVVVAAATLAARRPAASTALAVEAFAIVGMLIALHLVNRRRARCLDVVVSNDREIRVVATSPALDGTWHLADATLAWPGFSMLAIERTGASNAGRIRFLPAFDAELDADDRRALARFLRWSMRGGAADRGRSGDDGRR